MTAQPMDLNTVKKNFIFSYFQKFVQAWNDSENLQ